MKFFWIFFISGSLGLLACNDRGKNQDAIEQNTHDTSVENDDTEEKADRDSVDVPRSQELYE